MIHHLLLLHNSSTKSNVIADTQEDVEDAEARRGKKIQGGNLRYKWNEITPISRVKLPQLPMYQAIYRSYNSIYNC